MRDSFGIVQLSGMQEEKRTHCMVSVKGQEARGLRWSVCLFC